MTQRWSGSTDFEQLFEMCSFGARAVHAGEADEILLKVMPNEVDTVKEIMSANFAEVPYSLNYPDFSAPTTLQA